MRTVALFTHWDGDFVPLMERIRGQTVQLSADYCYKDMQFVDPLIDPYDYALVLNMTTAALMCPADNVYAVILEPPEIVGAGWSPHPQRANHLYSFCAGFDVPVVYGFGLAQTVYAPDDDGPSTKPKRCSMICSDKTALPLHRRRREILHALMATSADIDFYGMGMIVDPSDPRRRGSLPLNDKSAGLRPYSFVIDFENTQRYAITDKMLDPLISGAVSVTNSLGAERAFPAGSFEWIDFDRSNDDIAADILAIITQPTITQYDQPVRAAKQLITDGELNVCEWLFRKIAA